MKEVLLNGFLGDKYGKVWNIKANNIKDIFSCISCNYPSFKRDMIDFAEAGGDIDVQFGGVFVESEEELLYSIGADTVVITPLPAGAKSGGAKLLVAALIVASFFIPGSPFLTTAVASTATSTTAGVTTVTATTATTLTTVGKIAALTATSLAMQGISQMMAPDPSGDDIASNDEYLFDGSQSTIAQNNVVPVLLGEMIVGGVMISSTTIAGDYSFPSAFSPGVIGDTYIAVTPDPGGGPGAEQVDTLERGRG